MENIFYFDKTICENSVFQYIKMEETDLKLLRHYNIAQWNGEDFRDESILKWGEWIINKDKDMLLKALGGGSFEIPEMYSFVYHGEKIQIECGGGGKQGNTFKHNEDGSFSKEVFISDVFIPCNLSSYLNDIKLNISEAFAIYSFNNERNLDRVTVIF